MKQISKYHVEDHPLGSGGMGKVLKGYTPDGIPVAIKEILPEFATDMEYRNRIDSEVRFLRKLQSDNVVKIYDYFPLDNNLYIVMEMVEGQNIEQYVESKGAISVYNATRFMMKILQTLQYIHEQGIIHRDIKPSNIMIRPNGEICLLDFGIAKDMNNTSGTQFGTILGTDGYMSPEQANGMSIDQRADIYSTACVFFYMLTAHHAYQKFASDVETQLNIVNTPFPRLCKYVKGIPSSIQGVLDHATDKNMLKRYQSCREFCSELMKVTGMGTQINPAGNGGSINVSIGRENCDICVFADNYKVSRHHADVTLKEFTGGAFYIYTDCSSNGTVIDGQVYTKGMSCNISKDKMPEVYLAGDINCLLDWEEVKLLINEKAKEFEKESTDEVCGKTITMNNDEIQRFLLEEPTEDSMFRKLLFGILSFFFPIIGWILFFVYRKKNYSRANICNMWAWIGFIKNIIIYIILYICLLPNTYSI